MLYISELLPNPAGKDTQGEWIEVCNAGSQQEQLAGWELQNAKQKQFILPGQILEPYQCRAFDYTQTKLTLTNTGTTIYLYNPAGNLSDTATYAGSYKNDVSAMRTNPTSAFLMSTTPTKGLQNKLTVPKPASSKKEPYAYTATIPNTGTQSMATVIHKGKGVMEALPACLLVALILTLVFWFACKTLYPAWPQKSIGNKLPNT